MNEQPPRNQQLSDSKTRLSMPLLAIAFILLLPSALQSSLASLSASLFPALLQSPVYPLASNAILTYLLAMPLSLLIFSTVKPIKGVAKPLPAFDFFGCFCLSLSLSYAGNFLGTAFNALLALISGNPPANRLADTTSAAPLWAKILFVVILAPIAEELFYRKLPLDRFRAFGELPAALICGISFGLIHGNFYQLFYAAPIGILFSLLYLRTGKILYTVILHMMLNLFGIVISPLLESAIYQASGKEAPMILLLFISFLIAITAFGILFLVKRKKPLCFAHGKEQLHRKDLFQILILNPGVWVFCAVILLLFFNHFRTMFPT